MDRAIALARSVEHQSALGEALTWRGALHYWQSDYAAADDLLIEGVQLHADLRDGFHLPASLFFQGLVRGNQGRISESLAVLNQAATMAQRNGDAFWWPRLPNCLGWIYRELQDFDRAADYDQQGLDIGREHAVLEARPTRSSILVSTTRTPDSMATPFRSFARSKTSLRATHGSGGDTTSGCRPASPSTG